MHSVCPDYGVEAKVNTTKPVPAQKLLPQFTDPVVQGAAVAHGPTDFSGDSDEGNNQQSADVDFSDDSGTDDALLEFDKMVLNPGTAHITHNAANTLEEVMPTYKMRTHQLGAVCDLCREQKHRPRLEQTCFSDGVGKTMWQDFTGFSGKVRRHRFATTSFSIPQALKVGPHLRSR